MRSAVSLVAAAVGTCLAVAATAGAAAREQAPQIAFSGARTGDDYTVYTVRADGGGRRTIGSVDAYAEDPQPIWAPDGRRVAFIGEFGFAVTAANGTTRMLGRNQIDDNISPGGSWSPDGRTIVVPAERSLWLVDVARARARELRREGEQPSFSPNGKLVAFYGHGLRVMNRDGSGVRRLAAGGPPEGEHAAWPPSWSPDGGRIAFERGGAIYVHDLRSGRTTTLSRAARRIDREPVWSPNGRWIAFVRGVPTSVSDTRTGVSIVRPDGSGLRVLTDAPFRERSPTWSPDSRRLAFLGGSDDGGRGTGAYVVPVAGGPFRSLIRPICPGEAFSGLRWGRGGRLLFASRFAPNDEQVYTVRTDGKGLRTLAGSCADETDPAWSPDGRRLAYTRGADVYVMDADGSHKRRLTDGTSPAWSPDGETIVFSSGSRELRQLYAVPAAGGEARRLTTTGSNSDPAWSAAAGRIAFTSVRGKLPQVWTMAPDGSDQRQVTRLGGRQPSWSPDGKRIAFIYDPNVFTIAPDGTDPKSLTGYDGCTDVYDPAWSPDGETIAFATYSNDQESGGIAFVPASGSGDRYLAGVPFAGARGTHDPELISHAPAWAPGSVSRRIGNPVSLGPRDVHARSAGCLRN